MDRWWWPWDGRVVGGGMAWIEGDEVIAWVCSSRVTSCFVSGPIVFTSPSSISATSCLSCISRRLYNLCACSPAHTSCVFDVPPTQCHHPMMCFGHYLSMCDVCRHQTPPNDVLPKRQSWGLFSKTFHMYHHRSRCLRLVEGR